MQNFFYEDDNNSLSKFYNTVQMSLNYYQAYPFLGMPVSLIKVIAGVTQVVAGIAIGTFKEMRGQQGKKEFDSYRKLIANGVLHIGYAELNFISAGFLGYFIESVPVPPWTAQEMSVALVKLTAEVDALEKRNAKGEQDAEGFNNLAAEVLDLRDKSSLIKDKRLFIIGALNELIILLQDKQYSAICALKKNVSGLSDLEKKINLVVLLEGLHYNCKSSLPGKIPLDESSEIFCNHQNDYADYEKKFSEVEQGFYAILTSIPNEQSEKIKSKYTQITSNS